jgi:hypothetical protein
MSDIAAPSAGNSHFLKEFRPLFQQEHLASRCFLGTPDGGEQTGCSASDNQDSALAPHHAHFRILFLFKVIRLTNGAIGDYKTRSHNQVPEQTTKPIYDKA